MVYFFLVLNSLLMIILPLLLGIWLVRRYQVTWPLFLIGAAGFVVSQLAHIPFNQFVLNPFLAPIMEQNEGAGAALLAAVLFGLSAGVFEEVTRAVFYYFRDQMRRWEEGLMFGAGWGGIEAIIFGFLAGTSIVNIYFYQSGLIETLLSSEELAGNAEAIAAGAQQIAELLNSPPWMLLLGAVERAFALTLHLSLSILVLQVFLRRSIIWLFLAIGWHTLANAAALFGALQEWNPLLIEAVVGVTAVISFFFIRALRPQAAPDTTGAPPPAGP